MVCTKKKNNGQTKEKNKNSTLNDAYGIYITYSQLQKTK